MHKHIRTQELEEIKEETVILKVLALQAWGHYSELLLLLCIGLQPETSWF